MHQKLSFARVEVPDGRDLQSFSDANKAFLSLFWEIGRSQRARANQTCGWKGVQLRPPAAE